MKKKLILDSYLEIKILKIYGKTPKSLDIIFRKDPIIPDEFTVPNVLNNYFIDILKRVKTNDATQYCVGVKFVLMFSIFI